MATVALHSSGGSGEEGKGGEGVVDGVEVMELGEAARQRVQALRRQKVLLKERLEKAQERGHRLSQEEEAKRSLTAKMQRVMAMELRDQEKGNTQRVVNEAGRLMRLFATGFSPETSEPCFLSRDASRLREHGASQERLRAAIDTFVEKQVQAPLSRSRMLEASQRTGGDDSATTLPTGTHAGPQAADSASSSTPLRSREPSDESPASVQAVQTEEERAYNALRADLQRLQACDALCTQQLMDARVRAARARVRERVLAEELHHPQHRPLDDIVRLTAERSSFIEQQRKVNHALREQLYATLREAQTLQPTAVRAGNMETRLRRQRFLLRRTRTALQHQRMERNAHLILHRLVRCETKETQNARELVAAACDSIQRHGQARKDRLGEYREALDELQATTSSSCLPMHDACGHALYTALGDARDSGTSGWGDESWREEWPEGGHPIVSFQQVEDALHAFARERAEQHAKYTRSLKAFEQMEEEVRGARGRYERLLWSGKEADSGQGAGEPGKKEGGKHTPPSESESERRSRPVLTLTELDEACDALDAMTSDILEDVSRLSRELQNAQAQPHTT